MNENWWSLIRLTNPTDFDKLDRVGGSIGAWELLIDILDTDRLLTHCEDNTEVSWGCPAFHEAILNLSIN